MTTDFFGFDTCDDHYKLQGLGDVSEMGDAVLGLVAQGLGAAASGSELDVKMKTATVQSAGAFAGSTPILPTRNAAVF